MKIRVEIKDPNASFWTEYDGEMVRTAVTRAFLNSAEENLQTVYHRELPWGGAIHGTHSSSHTETITVKFPQSVLNNLKNPTIQIENKEEAPSAESVIKKSKFVKVILVLSIAYCAFIFFALTPRSSIYTKGDPVTIDNAVCDLQGCNKPAECIRYNVNQRTGEQF
ncbi:hypothetical protein L0156_26530, partial [bacterium]|nr:hypothetical protein [bacterium]